MIRQIVAALKAKWKFFARLTYEFRATKAALLRPASKRNN